ncbi:MAG: glycosyltransferase [Gammaproteobacteria bacterium]
MPLLSIVVPTYREADNLPALAAAINDALTDGESRKQLIAAAGGEDGDGLYELIIADDDSADGTNAICAQLQKEYPLKLLSRKEDRGLSQAVLAGVAIAKGGIIVVMDADLSHPPSAIAQLVLPLLNDEADFSAGSRYVGGGAADKEWPLHRRLFSALATIPAKMLVPMNDPMSGFFAFRRKSLPPQLTPIGYKIGLEIAVKMPARRIVETPIFFRDRQKGESKLNWRETLNYLRHLRRLFWHQWPKRTEVVQFCAAGGMGMVIDLAVYFSLQGLGVPHLFARALAFWPAASFNWLLNRIMTFKTRPRPLRMKQWLQFCAASVFGFICNWGTYALLTSKVQFFADNLLPAFFIGVLVGTIFNFICADRIVFRQ